MERRRRIEVVQEGRHKTRKVGLADDQVQVVRDLDAPDEQDFLLCFVHWP